MARQPIRIHFTIRKYKMRIKGKAPCHWGSAFGCEFAEPVLAPINASSCLLPRCPSYLSIWESCNVITPVLNTRQFWTVSTVKRPLTLFKLTNPMPVYSTMFSFAPSASCLALVLPQVAPHGVAFSSFWKLCVKHYHFNGNHLLIYWFHHKWIITKPAF